MEKWKIMALVFLLNEVMGMYSEGEINEQKDWVFMDKFCFDEKGIDISGISYISKEGKLTSLFWKE
jgi:hypothetical protein